MEYNRTLQNDCNLNENWNVCVELVYISCTGWPLCRLGLFYSFYCYNTTSWRFATINHSDSAETVLGFATCAVACWFYSCIGVSWNSIAVKLASLPCSIFSTWAKCPGTLLPSLENNTDVHLLTFIVLYRNFIARVWTAPSQLPICRSFICIFSGIMDLTIIVCFVELSILTIIEVFSNNNLFNLALLLFLSDTLSDAVVSF